MKATGDDGTVYVHPFDDPLIWQGHASMIDEVKFAGLEPDAVVLSVGGGGLMCGVLSGLHRNGWDKVPIIAVETDGAQSLNAAIAADRVVRLEKITSVAHSLGSLQVAAEAFAWTKRHDVRSLVVTDASALEACTRFADDHRVLIEPASGAALAPAYERADALKNFKCVLVIVCGGAAVTHESFRLSR